MPGDTVVTWAAQSVRSVIFSSNLAQFRADELYLKAFNQQPSGYQSAGPNMPFASSQATGTERMGLATLQVNSGRVDLLISPSHSVKLGTLPVLGDLGGSLDLIQSAATGLCKDIAKLSRLALIVDLAKPANDNMSAAVLLSTVLPYNIPVEGTFDFMLQYTKRYELRSLKEMLINIVTRWSVAEAHQFVVGFGVSSVQAPQKIHIASLNLDVNTVPEIPEIEGAQANAIFREMREKIDAVRRGEPIG